MAEDDVREPDPASGARLESKKGAGISRISSLAALLLLPLVLAILRAVSGGDAAFFWGMAAGVAWTVVVMLAIFFIYRYREHEIEAGSRDV